MRRFDLSPTQERYVRDEYAKGRSLADIAPEVGFLRHQIYRAARRIGLQCRGDSESHRKHTLNPDALLNDSPDRRYWVGFFLADGCLTRPAKGARRVLLTLQRADFSHVELFRN
ncbi:MAG TPA: hypothetical protein VEI97_11855, partial [bacterium]|nr:hypothetical protein [bacterium]